jgi:FkbM family methyltransferase
MLGLVPGDVVSDAIALTGIYDLELSRLVLKLARVGGVMLDVGANFGYFSLLWAAARPDNHVMAFEPSPVVLPHLKRNVLVNQLASQIKVRGEAVTNRAGELKFNVCTDCGQLGWGKLMPDDYETEFTVPTVRLEDAAADVDEIAFVKIDVQGVDEWAVLGAEGLLRSRRIKYLIWEECPVGLRIQGINPGQAAALADSCGYRVERHGENWHATRE